MMQKLRLYFDTSVFGGIYDEEFQEETNVLFDMVKTNQIVCVYSDLCELELENAPSQVKEHFLNLSKHQTEYVELTEEMNNLATRYVGEKVVGKTSMDDCLYHL